MPRIFLSYRREDSAHQADRLYHALSRVVKDPQRNLFIDVDSIPAGMDFVKHLSDKVAQCDVLLALIGPSWLNTRDPQSGAPRLANANDFVRTEIKSALLRDIPVVPVLLDGAQMPPESDLPEDLKPLARRQAIEVRRATFDADAQRLIRNLELLRGNGSKPDGGTWEKAVGVPPFARYVAIGLAAILLAGGGVAYWAMHAGVKAPGPESHPAAVAAAEKDTAAKAPASATASTTQPASESPSSTIASDDRNIGLVVNARGEMCIVFDKPFDDAVQWVTYSVDKRKLSIQLQNGRTYPIDWTSTDEMDKYLKSISTILVIRMENKKPAEGWRASFMITENGILLDKASGIKFYTKAIASDPKNAGLYLQRGKAFLSQKDYKSALSDFVKSSSLATTGVLSDEAFLHSCFVKTVLNEDLADAKNTCDESVRRTLKALEHDPEAFENRAILYLKLGKAQEALDDFNAAIQIRADASYYYGSGIAKFRLNRIEDGQRDMDKARRLDPTIAKQFTDLGISP